ncbi:oxygenase MpaB family protein [Candidatus Poriferisocius sp.]|uniref:oxygenase MpaB family protein n=1 Tax=Candidatus Poriferisocius sp. TaxID=3101276 RepID=UPI003B52E04E
MTTPTDYDNPGYARACALEPEMAENYLAHTMIGDPLADAAVEVLSAMKRSESAQLISAYMTVPDGNDPPDAPEEVHALFEDAFTPPDWLDPSALTAGIHMFHRNRKMVVAGMLAGVLVEGFSTNISESFFVTGRLRDQGVRRLQQNNRHMVEIFLPGGMLPHGDGWRLSFRIRLVHAQVRYLLKNSEDWDEDALGVPLSAAHCGYAITAFSARLLKHMRSLGAAFSVEEAASFMATWRYSGLLMGIPDSILFQGEQDALKLYEVGTMCEPEPGAASVVLANSLVNSAPLVVGINDSAEGQKLSQYVYKVSRALIGDTLANQLNYPKQSTFGVLPWFRVQAKYDRFTSRFLPKIARKSNVSNFTTLLSGSWFHDEGITYHLPDHVYAEKSSEW